MEFRYILVSFCNLPSPTIHPVLCLRIPRDLKNPIDYTPITLGYPEPVRDARGLASNGKKIFILFSRFIASENENKYYLAILRQHDLSPLSYQELTEVKDGHSVFATKKNIYVLSTGTDEVLRYDILENGVHNSQVIWRASEGQVDTHHINSITELNGELYISAFGPKTGVLWSSASNGYIHNITREIRVREGIYHPHSLSGRNGNLYYCESSRRLFRSLDTSLFEMDGYTRGGGWLSDELVCITSSIGRRVSKSTGLVANPSDPGDVAGKSNLAIGNVNTRKLVVEVDLSWMGPEVYDVLSLDAITYLQRLLRSTHLAKTEWHNLPQAQPSKSNNHEIS